VQGPKLLNAPFFWVKFQKNHTFYYLYGYSGQLGVCRKTSIEVEFRALKHHLTEVYCMTTMGG